MLNLDHNFTVQPKIPWIPYCLIETSVNPMDMPQTRQDIKGSFVYHGTEPDSDEWIPNEHGPEKYRYKNFVAYIAETTSKQRGEPVFADISFLGDTICNFAPYSTLDNLIEAIWFFCHEIYETSTRLEFLQKARELCMLPDEYELREFLTPPSVSEYSEHDRKNYLAERRLLSEHVDWKTPEYRLDCSAEWHVPHHDTKAEIIGKSVINGLKCDISGLSSDGRDISHYIVSTNLDYTQQDIIKDVKQGTSDKVVAVQTAPFGWHVLSVVYDSERVTAVSSSDLRNIPEGTVFDISATTRWADSFVSISGRGIWAGKSDTYFGHDNEYLIFLPATQTTAALLGIATDRDRELEAEENAEQRKTELSKETA